MATTSLERLKEVNEAGETIQEYRIDSANEQTRIDLVSSRTTQSASLQTIIDVFLPTGFPHSVTDDYVEYQIYDSLQAFSSSIAGLLSSRAVLASLGVGDAAGSATAAVVLKVLQESLGRLSTILFAHRYATVFEPECKMYRLMADVLNDWAFILDCLSPALPEVLKIIALTSSGILRSLCGVAAGSSKASLSAHFAKWGNLAELNAKDSSQETVISLLGMLCGTFVVTMITSPFATWSTLIFLLAMHLELNRRAVRAVSMTTMNRQRAGLVYHSLAQGKVPTPKQIAAQEKIFELGGALRDADGNRVGTCRLGVSLQTFLSSLGEGTSTGAVKVKMRSTAISSMVGSDPDQRYILWYEMSSLSEMTVVDICLKQGATAKDQILAWWHATALACDIRASRRATASGTGNSAREEGQIKALRAMKKYEDDLTAAGWNLDESKLETSAGTRVVVG